MVTIMHLPSRWVYLTSILYLFGSSSSVQGISSPPQQVLSSSSHNPVKSYPQHGRFLHLTDIHMDDHYRVGATITSFCHRDPKKHKKKKARKSKLAGHWGTPASDCDASPHMVYHSIDWIAQEWKDKIDFIVWTGDNARHDTEPDEIRRSGKEILGYNIKITRALQQAFRRSFDNSSIPLVPCLGNNDVHPHNKLTGPIDKHDNTQLVVYSDIWSDLIPTDQVSTFHRGGYYRVDVSRGIRVLSLNTLYFFESNDAVGQCGEEGPGKDHMVWIQQQLEQARSDGVKVYMMGHVPPTTKTFKRDCLDGYIHLALEYQDVIQAHLYGHANLDHFQILHRSASGDYHSPQSSNVGRRLHRQYQHSLKHYNGTNDLVVVHVAPPLLPVYNPTFRINEYNTDPTSHHFGRWMKYTQWYTDLGYWNEQYRHDKTTRPVFKVEYATDVDYDMKDLSVQSWLDLAWLFVQKSPAAQNMWSNYLQYMVVQT
ncbi:Metallo-dependent phosphatase-like protein [Chlamydoabsidia padenii]|nr:Metallo-dependent phosphatase-like protein [Chlamydoabsidia padenii]